MEHSVNIWPCQNSVIQTNWTSQFHNKMYDENSTPLLSTYYKHSTSIFLSFIFLSDFLKPCLESFLKLQIFYSEQTDHYPFEYILKLNLCINKGKKITISQPFFHAPAT